MNNISFAKKYTNITEDELDIILAYICVYIYIYIYIYIYNTLSKIFNLNQIGLYPIYQPLRSGRI